MKRATVFLFLLIVFSACVSSQPLPEEKLPALPVATTPPPPLNFISFELVPSADKALSLSQLIPDIDSMQALDFSNPVNVLENDLNIANVPDRKELVSSILESREIIYLEPKKEMNIILFYTIFKFNSSKNAERALEIYRTNWNTENATAANKTLWLWRGYLPESAGLLRPFTPPVIIYYDGLNKKAFLSGSRQNMPAVAELKDEPLYSLHGETAAGEYFLMMDVKARLPEVENRSMKLFEEILSKIKINETAEVQPAPLPAQAAVNKTAAEINREIEALKLNMSSLLDSYLKGNISQQEYLAKQAEISKRIEELKSNSSAK